MTDRARRPPPPTLDEAEFERHAERSVHFFCRRVPPRLRAALATLESGAHIVDVGCGDGQLVWALIQTGALPPQATVLGVDVSSVRVERFRRLTGWPSLLADGERLASVPDAVADLCVSTMVMEHVPDDAAYAAALARITKPGGCVYLTTVLRKPGAWYFRKAPDGRRVLDPTHVREYGSVAEVQATLEAAGFRTVAVALERLVFPVLVPAVRIWNVVHPIRDVQRFFLREPWATLVRVGLPIPRYREIQFVLRRHPAPAVG